MFAGRGTDRWNDLNDDISDVGRDVHVIISFKIRKWSHYRDIFIKIDDVPTYLSISYYEGDYKSLANSVLHLLKLKSNSSAIIYTFNIKWKHISSKIALHMYIYKRNWCDLHIIVCKHIPTFYVSVKIICVELRTYFPLCVLICTLRMISKCNTYIHT